MGALFPAFRGAKGQSVLLVLADSQVTFFFFGKILFIHLFLAALGLHCCSQAFSSCSEQGLLFIAVRGFSLQWLLLLRSMGFRCMVSVVVACGLRSCGSRALERRLSSCGARA